MNNAARYAYLDTRISLFASRLLEDTDIERLIASDTPDQDNWSGLGEAIGMDGEGIDGIDRHLMPDLLCELGIILRSVYQEQRDLLRFWAIRFEIANLKSLLRGKIAGNDYATLKSQLVDLGPFGRVNMEPLLLSTDTPELLRLLEHSAYSALAREIRRSLSQQQERLNIDATIDRHYFSGLARRARSAGHEAQSLIGSMIDRVNLVWLLRYRFSYDLPPAQAYYLLIPAGYRLTRDRLLELSRLEHMAEVLEALPEPFLGMLEGVRTISEVTRRLEYHTWNTALRILRGRRFNPVRALAYMILRERDLRRVRAIVQGRHLGMDADLLRMATGLLNVDGMTGNDKEAVA